MNPRAAVNDLLPFQGSPFGQLGYFSKLPVFISHRLSSIQYEAERVGFEPHAPLRTNGFQDRLVMTTSIPLHVGLFSCRFLSDIGYFITLKKPEFNTKF